MKKRAIAIGAVVVALISAAPTLVSWMAPALIERGFARSYAGSIEVAAVRLGWWTRTVVGPIGVLDSAGARVGHFTVEADASLWRMVRERWWSEVPLVVGDVFLRGELDLVLNKGGRSNLQGAIAPRVLATPRKVASGVAPPLGVLPPIEGSLHLDSLRVAVTDLAAADSSPLRAGVAVRDLSGTLVLDFVGDEWKARGSLLGTVDDGVESGALDLDASVTLAWSGGGTLAASDVAVDAKGIPILLIDGIAGMRGTLAESIGSTAEAKVRFVDEAGGGTFTVDAKAPGAVLGLDIERSGGIVSAKSGSHLRLDSTAFLSAFGVASAFLEDLDVVTWPRLVLEVHEFRLPPGDLLRDRVVDPRSVDWRGTELSLAVETSELRGRFGALSGASADEPELVIAPSKFTLGIDEAGSGMRIRGDTRLTLAGHAAGESSLDVVVRDMLDKRGRFSGAWGLEGELVQTGLATTLLQPSFDAAGLAIDGVRDIGPVVDRIVVSAHPIRNDSTGEAEGSDLAIEAHAANLDLRGRARLGDRELLIEGDGVVVRLKKAGPLLRRAAAPLLAALPPGPLALDKATARLDVTDFRFDRSAGSSTEAIRNGRLTLALTDLSGEAVAADGSSAVHAEALDHLREVIGDAVTLEAEVGERDPAKDGALPVRATVTGQGFETDLEVLWAPSEVRIDRASTTFDVSPDRASRMIAAASGHPVAVKQPLQVLVDHPPFRFGRAVRDAPSEALQHSVKGTGMEVENLPFIDPARRIAIEFDGSLSIGRSDGRVKASLKSRLRGRRESGDFDYGIGDAEIDYERGGKLALDVALSNLNAAVGDVVPAEAGDVRDLVGVDPHIKVRLRREKAAAALRLDLDISSSRIEARDLGIVCDDTRIYLPRVERIVWNPDPKFLGRLLMGNESSLRNSPSITLRIDKLVLAREQADADADATGTFRPGVFALEAALSTPEMVFTTWSGGQATASDVTADLDWVESQRGLAFDARVAKLVGQSGEAMKPSRVHGVLAGAADSRGFLSTAEAKLTSNGSLQDFPASIIDSAAGLDRVTALTLGPSLGVEFETAQLSRRGGSVKLHAEGRRGEASVHGGFSDDSLIIAEPMRLELSEIRPELVDKLVVGLPLISSFEKKLGDGPAFITFEGLTAPLDGDMHKLNGVVQINLGRVRFETDALLGKAINLAFAQRGQVAREFKPFVVEAKAGVLTYEKYTIPIGDDDIAASGSVDLVRRQIDMVAYVPHVMLIESVAGQFKTGLSGLITGKVPFLSGFTKMPIRVRGPLDNPTVRPDLELFVKEKESMLMGAVRFVVDLPRRLFGGD